MFMCQVVLNLDGLFRMEGAREVQSRATLGSVRQVNQLIKYCQSKNLWHPCLSRPPQSWARPFGRGPEPAPGTAPGAGPPGKAPGMPPGKPPGMPPAPAPAWYMRVMIGCTTSSSFFILSSYSSLVACWLWSSHSISSLTTRSESRLVHVRNLGRDLLVLDRVAHGVGEALEVVLRLNSRALLLVIALANEEPSVSAARGE